MKIKQSLPSISVLLYVYNEEKNLKRLISTLKELSYPKGKIEYVAVDDSSTDSSPKLLAKFGAKVIRVKTHDVELNKGIAMHAAKNELVYWVDADMEICDKDFFKKLVRPLVEDKNIIGSFTREFALDSVDPVKNSFTRFICYDDLQCDPTYSFFSTKVNKTIVAKKDGYFICKFLPTKIPPCGRTLYRRKELLDTAVGKNKSFIDLETLEIVSRAGHQLFAFVPDAKIRHWHVDSLWHLIKKRPLRNLGHSFLGDQSGDYLPNLDKKYYLWFNSKDKTDALKVIFWVIYVNLFIPELIVGIFKSLKYRDLAFLWQPITSLAITDAVIYGFMSRVEGRKLTWQILKTLLS